MSKQDLRNSLENIEQMLAETMADFLESDQLSFEKTLGMFEEEIAPEQSELHIEMAKAAMKVFKNGIVSITK